MANLGDYIGAIVFSVLFFGVVALVLRSNKAMQTSTAQRNEELRKSGIHVDKSGIAIRTKREAPTRDQLIQQNIAAAQKGAERIAKTKAVSVGKTGAYKDPNAGSPDWVRANRR